MDLLGLHRREICLKVVGAVNHSDIGPDPLCSQKVWRKVTLVKFEGHVRKNVRGIFRKFKGNFRE